MCQLTYVDTPHKYEVISTGLVWSATVASKLNYNVPFSIHKNTFCSPCNHMLLLLFATWCHGLHTMYECKDYVNRASNF